MTAESRCNGRGSTGASRITVICSALYACVRGSRKTGITRRQERNPHLSRNWPQWHKWLLLSNQRITSKLRQTLITVNTMGGFVCRFCNGNSESDNGSVSLEISIRNRKIIVYVCQDCYSHLTGSAIIRCQYCGNIWLQKDSKMGKGLWTVTHCSLCKGADMEDVTKVQDISSYR